MYNLTGIPRRGLPANFRLSASSANGLFSVRGLPANTHLDRIYLNGLHTLLPFWITNESDKLLSLELCSTADHSVKYQQDNANWSAVSAADRETYVEIVHEPKILAEGHTPNEATMVCNAGVQKEFCEVFNQVGGIDKLKLSPKETVELVLLYVAQDPKQIAQTPVHSRHPSLGQLSANSAPVSSIGAGDNGSTGASIAAVAAIPDSAANTNAASDTIRNIDPADTRGGASISSDRHAHYQYMTSLSTFTLCALSEDKQTSDQYDVSLYASFCKSVLEMDPPTSRIYLDDCVVGKPYERILRVKNASAIGLDWSTTVVETTDTTSLSSLQLLDSSMGPLSGGHLAGGECSQLFIRYTPQAVGEFLCRFLIENNNDPSNQRYWVFRARASQRQKPKRVELLSDPDINFGDCTSDVWYQREITFKNVSEMPIAMHFRVEGNTANLTMKSSVKAKQDNLGAALSNNDLSTHSSDISGVASRTTEDQISMETVPLRIERVHSADTPASNRSDDGLADDNMSESVNANDAQDEITSKCSSLDGNRGHDANSGVVHSFTEKAVGASNAYSRGGTLDDGSTQTDIITGSDPQSANMDTQREPSTHLQSQLDANRRILPRARLAASYSHQPAQFDEVLIKPGSVRTVVLSLIGKPVNSTSVNAGQFDRQSFTFFCDYATAAGGKQSSHFPKGAAFGERSGERLSLPCTVNMCTPFVRVTPLLLDFGNVDVGMLKTMYLQIENQSQVEATIQCNLESKVINCIRTPVVIPPLQSESIRVDIYPRRINARYRKQIIVRNKHNHLNDNVVEVRSVHVDQRRMAFHNLFYKTLVPQNEQNFVDFGAVPFNSRVMRKINLQNLCRCPITIELSSGDSNSISAALTANDDGNDNGSGSYNGEGDSEGNTNNSTNSNAENNISSRDSSTMIAAYTVTPLLNDGVLTQMAKQVARQLPLLERQAVMHSNIEALKEHSGNAKTANELSAHSSSVHILSQPRASSNRLRKDANISRILQPDVFVDKAVERGHVCLVPFARKKMAAGLPFSIDYLDVPSSFKNGKQSVKIQNSSGSSSKKVHTGLRLLESQDLQTSPATSLSGQAVEDMATTAIIDRAMQILDQIIDNLDMVPKTLFPSQQAEDEYVRKQVDLHKYIDLLVESGFLQPAHRIVLSASSSQPIIVMFQPFGIQGTTDKSLSPRFDANLYFKLIERPSDLLPFTDSTNAAVFSNSYQLPVRRFLIQASLRRTELELGQKSINVGNMQVDESSRKYLVIHNRTETPLMYAIRKTGSIASGDIQFVDNNRYGVVRGFDSRKVVFVFSPSLHGTYNEQISIANVLDVHGGRTAILKAVVRRPSKFYIQSLTLEFGAKKRESEPSDMVDGEAGVAASENSILGVGETSKDVQLLSVKNMTSKTRHLVVRPLEESLLAEDLQLPAAQPQNQQQPQSYQPDMKPESPRQLPAFVDVTLDPLFPANIEASAVPKQHYDRDTEEKIEALEQKIKIATRKNRPEKIEKYRLKLAKLRGTDPQTDNKAVSSSFNTGVSAATEAAIVKRIENDTQVILTLPPNCTADIPVVVTPRVSNYLKEMDQQDVEHDSQAVVASYGQLVVHEEKDKDNVKVVTLKALVKVGSEDLDAAVSSNAA
ncbi:hypothetical protein GGI25_000657 [Coemansia spiralis]|uniref:Uncharacterized protein n=2 Tax=Coemansia TaxID=4863 RepID=A0A9W8GB94_9FUNG|nr:hypothetical protein EDC05_000611 [Coemansia umbellata]KAJ2623717.1 hypothetical protein GGI26_002164 [Coemansia sp. RSA 1358]KAJ2680365.1 hypothetical protein GGI25_000657 [Coemansia spiralis]